MYSKPLKFRKLEDKGQMREILDFLWRCCDWCLKWMLLQVIPWAKKKKTCMETRLIGQYNAKWLFGLVYVSKPLITKITAIELSFRTNCFTFFSFLSKEPQCSSQSGLPANHGKNKSRPLLVK